MKWPRRTSIKRRECMRWVVRKREKMEKGGERGDERQRSENSSLGLQRLGLSIVEVKRERAVEGEEKVMKVEGTTSSFLRIAGV